MSEVEQEETIVSKAEVDKDVSKAEVDKEEQLVQWLQSQQLGRHSDKLMDMNGEVGLQSLEDLLELADEDLHRVGDSVNMNMIEKKRFLRAVQSLRSPDVQTQLFGAPLAAPAQAAAPPAAAETHLQAPEEKLDPAEVDAAIAKEAANNDQYEVVRKEVVIRSSPNGDAPAVGTLGEGRVLHANKERVLGGDNQIWAELTSLELRRSRDSGVQATRGFVLIDGSRIGEGLQLRGPLTGEGGVKHQNAEEAAIDAAELQAALAAFNDVPDHADLFEVVWSLVFVTKAPDKDAPRVGALRKGRVVHVKREPVIGADGRMWVELTNLELWRSCEPTDANDRGFALIDGKDLGLGQLLHGPIPRNANMWLAQRNHGGAKIDPAALKAALSQPPPPFDKLESYAELYEVQRMAFVKVSADEKAKTIGCLKQGQIVQASRFSVKDAGGHDWVELTSHELWHSCKPGSVDDRGYVLVNAEHIKEVGSLLLRGPLPKEELNQWKELQRSEQNGLMAQKHAERMERQRDAEQFEKRMKDGSWDESLVVYKYRALRNKVFVKWSEDPRHEWITQSACQPGTTFYSTGAEWRGPSGERWIDGCTVNNKPRWLLAEDPLAIGGPYLVEKMYTEQHIAVAMNYITVRGVELFETLVDRNATAKALKERFCKEVNLVSDVISLKAKFSDKVSAMTTLNDKSSLTEQGVTPTTQLFVEYENDVYSAMMVGRALGWLAV